MIMRRTLTGNEIVDRFIAISWGEVKWFKAFLFMFAKEKDLIPDLKQTINLAATECWSLGLNPDKPEDVKRAWGIAQNAIYKFLTSNGLRKPKGLGRFISHETPLPESENMDDMSQKEMALLLEISEEEIRKTQNFLFWTHIRLSVSEEEWIEIRKFLQGDNKKLPKDLQYKLKEIITQ